MLYNTNILIDQLKGVQEAAEELRHSIDPYISIVTWIEVLAGAMSASDEVMLRRMLANFTNLPLTQAIAERTAVLRRERNRLELPDALILTTAQVHTLTLVTRNTRDFPLSEASVRIPYIL